MAELTSEEDVRAVLEGARVVAVLGAHRDPERPAFFVPDYLKRQGMRILPVNPKYEGEELFGQSVRARLTVLEEVVDVVDVFRGSGHLPDHQQCILDMSPRPRVVWFQKGIRNDAVARALTEAGIDVIQDRCMYADHEAMGIPPAR